MAKLTAWLVTIVGVLLLLPLLNITSIGTATSGILGWLIALAILIVGIGKLVRNYSSKKR